MKRFISKMAAACMVFVSVFAFVAVSVNAVNTQAGLTYDANNATTSLAIGDAMSSDTIMTVSANRAMAVATRTAALASNETDETISFTKGLLPNGGGGSTTGANLKISTATAGAVIGVYYTLSDGKFESASKSKAGSMVVYGAGNVVKSTATAIAATTIACYYTEYKCLKAITADDTDADDLYIGSSENRFILLGYVVYQGEAPATFEVSYKETDGTILSSETLASGATITYVPKKWGYDFEGWYDSVELTTKIASDATVTADTTLYAKWTAWAEDTLIEDTINLDTVAKVVSVYGASLSADAALTSFYTLLSGVTTTGSARDLPDGTTSVTAIVTKDPQTAGIKITAPAGGKLTIYAGNGSNTATRTASLLDGDSNAVACDVTGADAFAASYDAKEITYTLTTGGTYYFGNDEGGIRVYYMSYETTTQTGKQEGTAAVRFVARTSYAFADIEAVGFDFVSVTDSKSVTKDCTTVYTSLTVNSVGTIVDAETGYLYFAYTVTGFTTNYEMTAQAWVQVNGVKVYGEVVTYTFTAE